MNRTQLIQKIDSLPVVLQQQVADFVEFLSFKNAREDKEDDLTESEIKELNRRSKYLRENPDSAVSLQELKAEYKKKYDL